MAEMGLSRPRDGLGPDEGEEDARTLSRLWRILRAWTLAALRAVAFHVAGAAAVLLAVAIAALLASWSPHDPSFSVATGAEPANLLGPTGAVLADVLMQWFGIASWVFVLPPLAWGLRLLLLTGEPRWTLKLVAWPLAAMVAAIAIAGLPVPPQWVLQVGLGGAIGDLALRGAAALAGPESWPGLRLALGIVAAFAAVLLLGLACGVRGIHLRAAAHGVAAMGRGAGALLRGRRDVEADGIDDGADAEQRTEAVRPVPVSGRLEPRGDARPGPAPAETAAKRVKRTGKAAAPKRPEPASQARLALEDDDLFQLPSLQLLAKPKPGAEPAAESDEALEQNARQLETVLSDFGVRGQITSVRPGPVVTLYEFEPAAGIKASRIISLADDIARSMSAIAARVAVVPGRNVIGIELPNRKRAGVLLRELLSAPEYDTRDDQLILALGKDISGAAVFADLARMPHLLIAGTTGSGKSVAINTMILSLLYRLTPAQCRLILVDPKMLELSVYDGIPHLLSPVVTEPKKAIAALKWTVREMEDRYRKMSKLGVRNIAGYNERVTRALAEREVLVRRVQTGFDRETGEPVYETEELELARLPFIVVVVDEMADLMIVAGKEIEGLVQRLAQMARAAGIHLITATQRPSVDVITGTIKANFPTRISFQVTSKIDSRTILGEQGAEQLLGQGDMLYMAGGGRIRRVHGPFVSDAEVEAVVKHLKGQGRPDYLEEVTAEPDEDAGDPLLGGADGEGDGDDLYRQAVEIVARDRKATTSYIQRRLQIGYNRAARIIERMEEDGILSAPSHTGKREILVDER